LSPAVLQNFLNLEIISIILILIGKYRRLVEKLSLKDTAMKLYRSKLEEVDNRRIVSLDMNLIDMIDDKATPLRVV
jgi:hypothetical protein